MSGDWIDLRGAPLVKMTPPKGAWEYRIKFVGQDGWGTGYSCDFDTLQSFLWNEASFHQIERIEIWPA